MAVAALAPVLAGAGGAAAGGGILAGLGGATGLLAGAQAIAPIAGAIGQFAQSRDQSAQIEAQGRAAEIRGMEVEASLRDEYSRTLSTFNAARGANGLSLTSPTGAVIAGDIRSYARQNILTERSNTAQGVGEIRAQARATRRKGAFSLLNGAFSAAPPLLSFFQNRGV